MKSHLLTVKARKEASRGFSGFALLWSARITSTAIGLFFCGLLVIGFIGSPDYYSDAFLVLIPVLPAVIAWRRHLIGGTLMVLVSILSFSVAYPVGGVEGFPLFVLFGIVFTIGGVLHLIVGWKERRVLVG